MLMSGCSVLIQRTVRVEARITKVWVKMASLEKRTPSSSEPSVIVAVSAPHRGEAFVAAREIIDELKASAPIWKREADADGRGDWVPGVKPA